MAMIVFLDTNIYLHYKDFDQIDWLKVLNTDNVDIVVPPVVIRELNKHKDSHSSTRVKKRAEKTLKKLFTIFESGYQSFLNKNVRILFEDRDPIIDFAANQLSREIQDDNLIASIMMYQKEVENSKIVLITSDLGLTLLAKAKRRGIRAIRLPDELKLLDEIDPEQKRIKDLEQEIRDLKSTTPKLLLTFNDRSQKAEFILSPVIELLQKEIDEKIGELREKYPKRNENPNQIEDPKMTNLSIREILSGKRGLVSNEDIKIYNDELEKFFQTYASYMKNEIDYKNFNPRTIIAEIWLLNEGTAPAEDVDIIMHFPDGFGLSNRSKYPIPLEPPEPPLPPEKAWEKLLIQKNSLFTQMPLERMRPNTINTPPNVSAPKIKRSNSYDVQVHVQHIKHNLLERLDPLYLTFDPTDEVRSFHIDYQILAANLPKKTTGKLHFIIREEKK